MANAEPTAVFADTDKAVVRDNLELLDERDSIQGESDQDSSVPFIPIGNSWEEMTHDERAVFINEFNRKSATLDRKISDRDKAWTANEPAIVEWIEPGSSFLSTVDPPVDYLVGELLPAGAIALLHGEPRTRKSWAALDIAIAVSTGAPAFNLQRFTTRPERILYSSQEDGARLIRQRTRALLAGRGMECPEGLNFAVHRAIDLDNEGWRTRIIEDILRRGIRLFVLDPIRRYSANADKGPSDVQRITAFLRLIVNETGCTVLIVHHDVKPPAQGKDERRRAHRASGGDWFAAAECPISLETAGDNRTLAYPTAYKTTTDPAPFSFSVESDDPRQPKAARLVGEDQTAEQASDLAEQESVLSYLGNGKRQNISHIETHLRQTCRIRNGGTKALLERMAETGKLDCLEQGKGKAILWWIRKEQ